VLVILFFVKTEKVG